MRFSVCSDKSTYQWDSNDIYGELYMVFDDCVFPAEGWSDMVCDVLIMWAQGLMSLLESETTEREEFFFLEKPYSFAVSTERTNMAQITLYDDSKPFGNKSYEVSLYTLIFAISSVIAQVVQDERLQDIHQIKRLKNLWAQLKQCAQQLGYVME